MGLVLEQVGEVSRVAVVEGNLAITLAPTAVAMVARGPYLFSHPDRASVVEYAVI